MSHLVSYEKRVVSYAIDILICFLISLILSYLGVKLTIPDWNWLTVLQLQSYIPFIIYGIFIGIMLYVTNGHTIGSLIMQIRIVREDKKHIGLRQAFLRSVLLASFSVVIVNAFYMLIYKTQISLVDELSITSSK